MISFSQWLRKSNEAKAYRDAYALCDQMPNEVKIVVFDAIRLKSEEAWSKTKKDLEITE